MHGCILKSMNVISRHVLSSKIVSDELLFEVWQAGEFIRQLVDVCQINAAINAPQSNHSS